MIRKRYNNVWRMYGVGMLVVLAFRWKALTAFSHKMQETEE